MRGEGDEHEEDGFGRVGERRGLAVTVELGFKRGFASKLSSSAVVEEVVVFKEAGSSFSRRGRYGRFMQL